MHRNTVAFSQLTEMRSSRLNARCSWYTWGNVEKGRLKPEICGNYSRHSKPDAIQEVYRVYKETVPSTEEKRNQSYSLEPTIRKRK